MQAIAEVAVEAVMGERKAATVEVLIGENSGSTTALRSASIITSFLPAITVPVTAQRLE